MHFNLLRTTPLSRGSQSDSPDLADQPMQNLAQDQSGDSTPSTVDLEARRGHEEVLKGLLGLSVYRRDEPMYLLGRRFRQQKAYCLDTKANNVLKVWGEIVQTIGRDGTDLDELNGRLFDALEDHDKMLLLIHQIEALVKPNGKLLDNFIRAVLPNLEEEDARFLHAPRDDWVAARSMEPMERWSKLVPEYRVGRFLCHPFRNGKATHEDFDAYDYPDTVFRVVVLTISHLVLVALVGVPVIIQTVGILSIAGNAAVYVVCLVLFFLLTHAVVPNESVRFFMSLAYSAVVASNLGSCSCSGSS